jgi:two-component system cell cycle sensor histidine kinase/response regulator CckA
MATAPTADAIRVLFVEDAKDDVELAVLELSRHGFRCETRAVETRPAFLDALASSHWDVVLSDHSMREFSSMEALALLRAADPDTPFIIVSGTIGEDAAVDAMKAGAQDYVLKQHLRRLGPAVEREMREADNRRQQRRTRDALLASEQQLRHAQKLEAVGRLAGGIAHDFNNLLTVILGFSEFLLERLPEGTPPFRDASEIQLAAKRATRLTKQLLAFSRQQVLEPRVVDLVSALTELQPMVQRLIGEDLHCEFSLGSSPQLVLIDPGQFEQVVLNLVINARDAMPRGGRLSVELSRADLGGEHARALDVAAGAYVVIAVTDTGDGMDDETVEHIFEPFFTTKAPGRGTGLGLSTVFGIVRQSRAGIEVRTAPKQGTTFRIYFPHSQAAAADDESVMPRAITSAAPSTILLAEDEEGVRAFLETALARAGHRVIVTSTGPEAVTAAKRSTTPIDLLITDVVMPEINGPEVAERVVAMHPRARVIFLSGYSTHSALPDNLAANPGAFLQKPFSVEALLAKVRDRLARP